MKNGLAYLLLASLVFATNCKVKSSNKPTNVVNKHVSRTMKYGHILLEFSKISIPEEWENYSVNFELVPEHKIDYYFKAISRELKKYPEDMLNKTLNKIYVLNKLRIDGNEAGGTRTKNEIFLADPFSFDAEFSSLLYLQHSDIFPRNDWLKVNGNSLYSGPGSDIDMLSREDVFELKSNLLKRGFLNIYSTTTLENDFNEIFKFMMSKPELLNEISGKYQKIFSKKQLVEQFIKDILKLI